MKTLALLADLVLPNTDLKSTSISLSRTDLTSIDGPLFYLVHYNKYLNNQIKLINQLQMYYWQKNNTNVLDYRLIRNSLYINEMNSSQDELQLHRIQNDLNIYDLSLKFTCCFLALHHHPYIQTYILDIRQHTIQN